MGQIGFIQHHEKRMLYLDFSYCEPAEVIQLLEQAETLVNIPQEEPLLLLENATGMRLTPAAVQAFETFVQRNKNNVFAAAMFGVSENVRAVLSMSIRLSQKRMQLFVTKTEAKEWLTELI